MTQTIRFSDFLDDMQVLVQDFIIADNDNDMLKRLWKHEFRVLQLDLIIFPRRIRFADYRGKDYARLMIGQSLPPIIVCGQLCLDGYHRIWAARQARQKCIDAIDLSEIGYSVVSTSPRNLAKTTAALYRRICSL